MSTWDVPLFSLYSSCNMKKTQSLSDFSDFTEEEISSRRASLDSISTESQSYRSTSVISLSSNLTSSGSDMSLSTISGASNSKQKLTPKDLPVLFRSEDLIANSELVQQTYKMKKFRLKMDQAEKKLKKRYKRYKSNPLTHSKYEDEWRAFWTRRYKQLKADRQPTENHDYKPEWDLEWKKIMDERLVSDLQLKRIEIRQKLAIKGEIKDITARIVPKNKNSKKSREKRSKDGSRLRSRAGNEKRSSRKSMSSNRRSLRKSRSHKKQGRRSPSSKGNRFPRALRSSRRSKRSRSPRKSAHGSGTPRRSLSPIKTRSSPRKISISPQRSLSLELPLSKTCSPPRTGKPILNRRYTLQFATERKETAQPSASVLATRLKTPPPPTVSKEKREVIKETLSAALIKEGRTDITAQLLEEYIETYLVEAEKKKKYIYFKKHQLSPQQKDDKQVSVDSIGTNNNDQTPSRIVIPAVSLSAGQFLSSTRSVSSSSARPVSSSVACPVTSTANTVSSPAVLPVSLLAVQRVSTSAVAPVSSSAVRPLSSSYTIPISPLSLQQVLPSSAPKVLPPNHTLKEVSTERANKIPKMCPPPFMENEPVTLSDADLEILKKNVNALSKVDQEAYLSYIKKLETVDPERIKRLKGSQEKLPQNNIPSWSIDKCDKTKPSSKRQVINKPTSEQMYSPGENFISDEDTTTKPTTFADVDSDSDDSAKLASSIAHTQFKIAEMNQYLNPIKADRPITAASSVQPQQNRRREEITVYQNQVSRPALPPVQCHQQNFPLHRPQYPHQHQYQPFESYHPGMNYYRERMIPQPQDPAPYLNYYQYR